MAKDFYTILGVDKSASESDIKQAYRKLSKELHPDKHKGDKQKEEQFKAVNEAYEVLSDPKKRQAYDQFGSAYNQAGGGGFGGFEGFSGFQSGFQGGDFGNFSDLFESFFGGAAGGGGRRQRETRGRDMELGLAISLLDAVSGIQREVTFRALGICDTCKGSGSEPGSELITCPECSGTGQILRTSSSLFGRIQQAVSCPRCHGSGKIPATPCTKCQGEGRLQQQKTITVDVPAGIHGGQSIRMRGEGEAGARGTAAGDLLVKITVEDDPRFERDGDDIRSTIELHVTDAILGTTANVQTVHGPVALAIPAGTQPGQILRIKAKGMPVLHTHRTGDHYVTMTVLIPKKLSREERKLVEEWRKLTMEN